MLYVMLLSESLLTDLSVPFASKLEQKHAHSICMDRRGEKCIQHLLQAVMNIAAVWFS